MSSLPISPKSPTINTYKRKELASSQEPSSPEGSPEKKQRSDLFTTQEHTLTYPEPSSMLQPSPAASAASGESFAQTIQPPHGTLISENYGDSDTESAPESGDRDYYRFKLLEGVKPQKVTLTQNDGTKIKGGQLLLKIHQLIQEKIAVHQETSYSDEEIENTQTLVHVMSGKEWLKSAGYWAITGAGSEIKKPTIFKNLAVGPSALQVRVEIKEITYIDITDPKNPVERTKQTERLYFSDPVFFTKIFDEQNAFKCLFEKSYSIQNKLIENEEFCGLISEFFTTTRSEFTIELLWDKDFKNKFFKKFNASLNFKNKILEIFSTYLDFSCKEICMITNSLFPPSSASFYHSSMLAALAQLSRLKTRTEKSAADDSYKGAWLDYVNAWMFGVEASRVNATFVTGLMTLELIRARKTSYFEALIGEIKYNENSNKNEININGKMKKVGGEFPLATLYSGADNLKARRAFIERAGNGEFGTKELRRYPQWHGVPLKEIITIINWLHFKKVIDPNLSSNAQLVKIEEAVNKLIEEYYSK